MSSASHKITSLTNLTVAGGEPLVWGRRTYVMGIINVTPDSFSGDGLGADIRAVVEQARRFQEEGADFLDLGAESTRPGHQPVSVDEELGRLLPALEAVAARVSLPISVDTYKPEVARRALESGAIIINDIWGLKADPELARVAARAGAPIILMHNQDHRTYQNLLPDICASLRHSVDLARRAGVPDENIILDPGIGFGKTPDHNLEVLQRLDELKALGYPLLVGTSRKSTIGLVLDLPVDQRQEGTAATVALAIARGADLVRVHDVKEMVRVCRMSDAIVRGWRPASWNPNPESQPVTAYLGLGSNLGAREANLDRALELLAKAGSVQVTRGSAVYETAPWGYADQPPFLNCVLEVHTTRSPEDLLGLVKDIEEQIGRESTFRWGPRLIDIDILLYGDQVIHLDSPDLQVPHPRLHQRAFVLTPLAEVAKDLTHPVLKLSIGSLEHKVEGKAGIARWGPPRQLPQTEGLD
jgi:dihydropteroate synthase